MDWILTDTQPFSAEASQAFLFRLYWLHLSASIRTTPLNSRFMYPTAYWHLHLGIFNGHKQFKMSKMYPWIFPSQEVPPPVFSIIENGNSILLVTWTKLWSQEWLPVFLFFRTSDPNAKTYQFCFQNSTTSHYLHWEYLLLQPPLFVPWIIKGISYWSTCFRPCPLASTFNTNVDQITLLLCLKSSRGFPSSQSPKPKPVQWPINPVKLGPLGPSDLLHFSLSFTPL